MSSVECDGHKITRHEEHDFDISILLLLVVSLYTVHPQEDTESTKLFLDLQARDCIGNAWYLLSAFYFLVEMW